MKDSLQKFYKWALSTIISFFIGTTPLFFTTFTANDAYKALEGIPSTLLASLRSDPPSCAAYLKGYGNSAHLLILEINKSANCSVATPPEELPVLTTFDKYGDTSSGNEAYTLQNDSNTAAVQAIWVGHHMLSNSGAYNVTIFNNKSYSDGSERFNINLDNEITDKKNTPDTGRNKLILKSIWAIERDKANIILTISILLCFIFLVLVSWIVSSMGLNRPGFRVNSNI